MGTSGLLTRVAMFSVRRRRLVLSITALFVVVAAVLGTRAFSVLEDEGFEDPSSESAKADDAEARFGGRAAEIVVVAQAADGDVDSAASTQEGNRISEALMSVEGVGNVTSYWTAGTPPSLRSTAGDSALLLVQIRNFFGLWVVLVCGAAVVAVTRWLDEPVQVAVAHVLAWFLLLAAPRPVLELHAARCRGGVRGSDADQLGRLTFLPAPAWVAIFLTVTAASLFAGGALLLASADL